MSNRGSGMLLHISSLPSNYGIGTLGRYAYEFVDILADMKQKYWQVLPIGPTLYGDSPYQSPSAYAGNPYFIDLDLLREEGLLSYDDYARLPFGANEEKVDYGAIYKYRHLVFNKIVESFDCNDGRYKAFCEENSYWLNDYAVFMALKESADGSAWNVLHSDIKKRNGAALCRVEEQLSKNISKHKILQFLFFKQWLSLKSYAMSKGIQLIGDMPIYVAYDSSDVWSRPWLFELDEAMEPLRVAGCPPDSFSQFGQRWGNPLYAWSEHKEELFDWWTERLLHSMKLYDLVRIDHFRGFAGYYAIPACEATAINGKWEKGPSTELFEHLKKKIGKLPVIAEDLGFIDGEVIKLMKACGFPSMKVLQFAFESGRENDYLPHNYDKNCVVYTGTHDNDTLIGWLNKAPYEGVSFAKKYLGLPDSSTYECIAFELIRSALSSVGETVIIPAQDILLQGSGARMNLPSSAMGNWTYRLTEQELGRLDKSELKEWTELYGR